MSAIEAQVVGWPVLEMLVLRIESMRRMLARSMRVL
jgi:hypothetical protein